jgi:release factor glutamine methyltransferase
VTGLAVAEALKLAQQRIDAVDARVLLCHVLARPSSYVLAHPERVLDAREHDLYTTLVERRSRGEPVAYLTGEREFYGRTFRVTPAVLIPRPETELLVDLALERLPGSRTKARVLDAGTGSGCVALAIASERSHARVLAIDQSLEALAVARRNAVALHIGNVAFLQSDWYSALGRERFDLIVSNPPYVAKGDGHLTQGDLAFEPRKALDGGADGLDAIRRLISGARRHLVPGGWLLLEHGYDQAQAVRGLFEHARYHGIFSAGDLADIERVTGGRLTVAAAGS